MKGELEKCLGFIIELEKLKAVERKTQPIGLARYENSAEHSWQTALLAMSLAKFAAPGINIDRVLRMILVHDIGEIDAGDVIFFDDSARLEAKSRELAGVKRIFGLLPEDRAEEMFGLWNEFENGTSNEAKFARAIDRAMPVLQNIYNNRQSWDENGVTKEQILTKTAYIAEGSELLWKFLSAKIEEVFKPEQE